MLPNTIVELVNVMTAPELGMPLALKFALNQMKFPPLMRVPLKLEALDVGVWHGGDGGVSQTKGLGEKLMSTVLKTSPLLATRVAVPVTEKLPERGPTALVKEALKFKLESGTTEMEPETVKWKFPFCTTLNM